MSKGGFVQNTVKLIVEVSFPIIAGFLAWIFFTKIYPLSDGTNNTYLYPYGAAILAGGVVYILVLLVTESDESGVERGETLLPEWQARFSSWWQTRNDPLKFFWGGLYLPYSAGNVGLAAVGAPKSGKTVSIRLFLQSVLPHVGVVPDHRALIYDAKNEMMPIISGMGIDTHPENGLVKILNCYDTRSYYWEMSKDIDDIEIAPELALLFVPVNTKATDDMWSDSARELIGGVLEAFILGKKKWTLRDLLCATRTEERLKMVLGACDSTAGLIDEYLDKGRATQGILIQLRSRLSKFRGIAALWDNMPEGRGISLTEWLNDLNGSILLLGAAKEGTPLNAVNRLIIERIGQLIKDRQTDCDSRRTWIVIDELRQCGKLDLSTIGNMGRGRGASLVIGYQDQSGLRDAYNEDIAEELLGMCQHKAFFRLSSSVTAKWASEDFQHQEVNSGGDIRTQPAVMPAEFTSNNHIPETNKKNGLTGYYKSLSIGAYKRRLNGKKLFSEMLAPMNQRIAGIERIDVNQYPFKDWTQTDIDRLYKETKQLLLPAPEEKTTVAPLEGIGRGKNRKGSYATPDKEELERSIQNGRWNA